MMYISLSLSLSLDDPIFGNSHGKEALIRAGHVGTHLDTLLQRPIPLDHTDRDGVLIDARSQGGEISLEVLDNRDIRPGDMVLFHTGHIDRHPYGSEPYFTRYPQLDWALIDHLIDHRISFIGIDGPAVRQGAEHAKVDRYCEERGTYIIENLCNLERLTSSGGHRFPLRIAWTGHRGMTGLPVKVIALLEEDTPAPSIAG